LMDKLPGIKKPKPPPQKRNISGGVKLSIPGGLGLSIPFLLGPDDNSGSDDGRSDGTSLGPDEIDPIEPLAPPPPLPPGSSGDRPGSSVGRPPPPLVPEENDMPVRRALRGRRGTNVRESWGGKFDIARLKPKGIHTGWGATCLGHVNSLTAAYSNRVCKKEIHFGRANYSDDQCLNALKRWLLLGYTIQNRPDFDAQVAHLKLLDVTMLTGPLADGEDLDAELAVLSLAP
jgi:hypothetical protein